MAYLLMILMCLFTGAGQILVKTGIRRQEAKGLALRQLRYWGQPLFFAGGALVLAAPILYMQVLSRLGLTGAFGLNGLSYPLIYGLSLLFLRERGSWRQTAGVLIIFAGIAVWSM